MTRVLDFASGATYALDGSMREISDRVHVLAPYNVDIQTEELQTSYMDDDYEEEDEFDF
jgi:FtsZ-interacting cell division protein YlmF